MLTTALSTEEKIRLSHLERDIERGKEATLAMAQALLEIRERKYYREQYGTFEDYCFQKWGFSDRYGRLLLDFARNVADLKTGSTVPVLPTSEGQQRSLTQLETPAQKQEAMRLAAAIAPNSQPTSAHVEQAVKEIKRGKIFTPGQVVAVSDRDSQLFGQEFKIKSVNGVIIEAETIDAEEEKRVVIPFLITELTEETPEKPAQKTAPKPSPMEAIAAELDLTKTRCELLEVKLEEAIALLEQYASQVDLSGWVSGARKLLE